MAAPNKTPLEQKQEFSTLARPDNSTQFQQAVRVGAHEQMLAHDAGQAQKFAEPPVKQSAPETDKAKVQGHKEFLDRENVRTEDQAMREEADRPREAGLPGA